MVEVLRTRDVVGFVQGTTYTVQTAGNLALGWTGGSGLRWFDSPSDGFYVEATDGVRGAGFALWGSNETSDAYTATTGQQVAHGFIVVGSGSWIMATSSYEQYTYASRLAGPLVALTYSPSDKLYWSYRGLWTKENEWQIASDPRGANPYVVGVVVKPNTGYLTIQTTL